MIGMGFTEFALFLLLFGVPDNLGVPVGVPPAEQVQLMSDVAPENCLFYTAWATTGKLDPAKNPTERWFAQAKIQASWQKIQTQQFENVFQEAEFDDACEKELAALTSSLAEQAITRATAIFVENGERLASLTGGCVIQLEPNSVAPIAASIAALGAALPAAWNPREFKIEDNTYRAFTPPEWPVEISVGLRGQFAIIGVGPDAIAKIEKKVRTPEPAWLTDLKKKLVVQRPSSISHIEIKSLIQLMGQEPWWTEAGPVINDILKLDSLIAFESVCGLDEQGFLSRHRLRMEGKPVGLMSLFDASPLDNSDWGLLAAERHWTQGIRISIDNAMALIKQLIEMDGVTTLDEQLKLFEQRFGIKLKDDLLDHLDGTVLVQGNFDSGNPTAGLLMQLGIADEMSFFDNFQTFNEKVAELIENAGDGSKYKTEELDGVEVHSVEFTSDFGFVPEPVWCLHGGKLCLGLDRDTLIKRLSTTGETLAKDERLRRVLAHARQVGLEKPQAFGRNDIGKAISLVMSFSSMFDMAMGDSPLKTTDLPPTEVLVNGLEPSIGLTFRTADGFEVFSRQTIPSAAPGASIAAVAAIAAPSVHVARAAARQIDSKNRMRQILLALHNYHDANSAWPAQFNQDKDGKPLLSWRVHILPYLEEQALYDQFHLDEPWDSEHNIKLVEKMPVLYAHPKLKLEPGHTPYLGIEGKGTIWKAPKNDKTSPVGITLEEVSNKDGTSRTAALLEVPAAQAVIWSKPDDFEIDGEGFANKLAAIWKNGLIVAMVDASVFTYKADLSERQWRNLFDVQDGEPQELEPLRSER